MRDKERQCRGCEKPIDNLRGQYCRTCYKRASNIRNGVPNVGDVSECKSCKELFTQTGRTLCYGGKEKVVWCQQCIDKSVSERTSKIKPYQSSSKYARMIANAKKQGYECTVSTRYYKECLFDKPCHYCDEVVIHTGSGVDRIDSSVGYIEGNVVPCCPTCNVMKNVMSEHDMLNHMLKVLKHKGVV